MKEKEIELKRKTKNKREKNNNTNSSQSKQIYLRSTAGLWPHGEEQSTPFEFKWHSLMEFKSSKSVLFGP